MRKSKEEITRNRIRMGVKISTREGNNLVAYQNFDKIIDCFLDLKSNEKSAAAIAGGELGDYDRDNHCITLYGVENNINNNNRVRNLLNRITKNYKLVILSPDDEVTNIKILDIDI